MFRLIFRLGLVTLILVDFLISCIPYNYDHNSVNRRLTKVMDTIGFDGSDKIVILPKISSYQFSSILTTDTIIFTGKVITEYQLEKAHLKMTNIPLIELHDACLELYNGQNSIRPQLSHDDFSFPGIDYKRFSGPKFTLDTIRTSVLPDSIRLSYTAVLYDSAASQIIEVKDFFHLLYPSRAYDRVQWYKAEYPNPFCPTTTIGYSVPDSSHVKLIIFNIHGKSVDTLVNDYKAPGAYTIEWDPDKSMRPGVYFYRLVTRFGIETKKLILLR